MHTHDVDALKAIVNALLYLQKNPEEICKSTGICGNILSTLALKKMELKYSPYNVGVEMRRLFFMWPKFSGNETYPIPGCGWRNPKQQFIYTGVNIGNYWDKSSRYGRSRWSLVYFMIRRARQLIKDIESSTNTDNGV